MDWLENIKDTIAKRLKGAFGGTFIIVWSILNWRLLFILFNFDKENNLQERLLLIDEYWKTKNFWQIYIYPLLTTIFSVFVYSILNYLTYSITSFFSLRIKPFILNKIDKNTVVEKERHSTLEQQYINLDSKYNKEKKEFIETKNKVDELSGEKGRLEIERNFINDEIIKIKLQLQEKDNQLVNLRNNSFRYKTDIIPSDLFPGSWVKSFKGPDGFKGNEPFNISGNNYLIDGKAYFEINSIKLNEEQNFIELSKTSTIDGKSLVNKLIKVSDDQYIGLENGNIEIKYFRINNLTHENIDKLLSWLGN
jgi:hypothetical protein